MKSLIESIYSNIKFDRQGYGYSSNQNIPSNSQNRPTLNNIGRSNPIEMDPCADLYGWQKQLVDKLKENKDIYILSGPGSGKTAPVICYWINNIINIHTNGLVNSQEFSNFMKLLTHPETIPQVMWMVPIKNLGANIEQEMIERFTSIILQILNKSCSMIQNPLNPSDVDLKFDNNELPIKEIINSMSSFGRFNNKLLLSFIDGNNQVSNNNISEFKTMLGQLVKNYVKNALVGRIEDQIYSVDIVSQSIQSPKPFIIAIYESAKGIISKLDKLKLIVFDEAQRITGGREEDSTRAAQIGDSIHKVLFHNNGRNAKIAMLSGSTNPKTAMNVMHYFNIAYKRDFPIGPYQTPSNVTNPSDIRVFPMANLNDYYTQLRIIQTALAGGGLRKGGIVFIIFGKEKINRLIDQLTPTERGYIQPGKNMETSKNSLFNVKKDSSIISDPGDINEISDDRLRRAASNGLGYLYRPEEMTPAHQKDTTIIQNLFRTGKIKVIFATDAVREGINITCNEMYIPTILKPPDNKEMDAGSLKQLINRVGRKKDKYATIYTDAKFVGTISKALSQDSDLDEEPFVLPGSSLEKIEAGLNYGINLPIKAAKQFYDSFVKAFNNS